MSKFSANFLQDKKHDFLENGFCLIEGFYDQKSIERIRNGIRQIIELLCKKYDVEAKCETPFEAMTIAYPALIAKNRAWGGEIYDAVKQIPEFMTLVSNPKNSAVFESLRANSVAGLAAGGYGIRIDNPAEDKFRAPWHQEFPAQLRSVDGIVFWSPLLDITPEMGPVELCVGSHKEGVVPVYNDDQGIGKSGAYALKLEQEEKRLAKYQKTAPLTKTGDLILMDFLTLHQSGLNRSKHPRWSMQFRYFNFNDPTGIDLSWAGSFAAGKDLYELLPNLKAKQDER